MDKKEFYAKSEKIINETFQMVKKYAKIVAKKTGEAASVTKLLIQKATMEHQIAKTCSRLGSKVYDRAVRKGETVNLEDPDLKAIIGEIRKLEDQYDDIEKVLETERNKLKSSKPKAAKKQKPDV
jgi:predicted double-glycine peptidase